MAGLEPNGIILPEFKFSREKHELIEAAPSIKRLVTRVYRSTKSENSVRTYLDYLTVYLSWAGGTPEKALEDLNQSKVNDFIDYLVITRKWSPSSIKIARASVKKWADVNDKSIDWKKVEPPKTWRVNTDRLPSKEELRNMIEVADLASKTMVLILVSSGLRIGTLVKLRLKDIRMEYDCPMILVKPEAAKQRQSFITFMSPEAKKSLESYLKQRQTNGEAIGSESYLITKERPLGEPITSKSVEDRWHKLLSLTGKDSKSRAVEDGIREQRRWYECRVHNLRKFFKTWGALSGIQAELLEGFMGHRSGVAQLYMLTQDPENKTVVERTLEEYRKALPALTIFSDSEKVKELEQQVEEQKAQLDAKEKLWETRFDTMSETIKAMQEVIATLKSSQG